MAIHMDSWNYFNYFTEIENYFWKKRGAHLLVSPLDWAIMETWQKAGVPLDAVFKGIDHAFESYQRSRRGAGKPLKSLAYCTDAVLEAAQELLEAAAGSAPKNGNAAAKEPFSREELRKYFAKNAAQIASAADGTRTTSAELVERLREIRGVAQRNDGDARYTRHAGLGRFGEAADDFGRQADGAVMSSANEEMMLKIRREMDGQLAAYRRKMKAEQIALVEKQFLQKRLLEEFRLPRLSLYYFS